jgi:hypothetical protein
MSAQSADRNLLFGFLALQNDFVSHDQLAIFNTSINDIYNHLNNLPDDYAGKLTEKIVYGAAGFRMRKKRLPTLCLANS